MISRTLKEGTTLILQEVLEGPCGMVVQGGPAEYFMLVMELLKCSSFGSVLRTGLSESDHLIV